MPFHSDLSTGAGESGTPFDNFLPAPEWPEDLSILNTNRRPSRSVSLTAAPVMACRLKCENRLMKSRAITLMAYMMYDKVKNVKPATRRPQRLFNRQPAILILAA